MHGHGQRILRVTIISDNSDKYYEGILRGHTSTIKFYSNINALLFVFAGLLNEIDHELNFKVHDQ